MEHGLNMITLGVADVARARAFYEALGWQGTGGDNGDPVFFARRGMIVAIWDRAKLAEDSAVAVGTGWGGVTLGTCVPSDDEVRELTEKARAAGGTVAREPGKTFWGGYDSIVIDPDGYPWEIARNPAWTSTEDGGISPG
ncbi:VOC family protein [Dactylosporangium sp. CS-047395]|uniref:VOC family protein n=1 Tax=Dactylosporangium sp. CS-047395 TaxID=3239936 RepID=UPI003D8A2CEF